MKVQHVLNSWAIYGRILRQIQPHWGDLTLLLAVAALATPIALLIPVPLKIVVDSVLGSHPLPAIVEWVTPQWMTASSTAILWFSVGLVILIALVGLLQRFGFWILGEYLGEKLVLEFRSTLFARVSRLSLAQHDIRGHTDLAYRIQYDAPAVRWLVMDGALPLITAVLTLLGMIYVIARINVQLALAAVVVIPIILVLTHTFSGRLRANWKRVKILETGALSVVQEVLGAMRVVKAFGQERREQERFFDVSRQTILERIRVVIAETQFNLLVGLSIAAGTATVLFVGAQAVRAGQLTTGELLLVMAYIAQLYDPIQVIGKQVAAQQSSLVSAERAFSILDEKPSVQEVRNARPIARAKGDLAFVHVGFAYNSGQPVLRDVTFEVRSGATVGIVGKTGAGKTTLVSLLTRFYDPTEGAIYLDGVDLRTYRLGDLGNQYAIVLQEPVLFPTTIAENIAYGTPGAHYSEIVSAAKAANAHDFIQAFAQGYETLVGDRGTRLSGGERQRVSLARAFIRNSPLLILDEPTSSVDSETDAAIMDAMLRLIKGRTTFIIAHRMATLRCCNLLLVLEGGRLAHVIDRPQAELPELKLS
jgi:ATP-binding cassette subfamily B protein